jgi:hypothetical protein
MECASPCPSLKKEDYEHIVSIGRKCQTTLTLKRLQLYKESYPFDFVPTSPHLILKYLKDQLDFFPLPNQGNNRDGVWFGHFDVHENYAETIQTFQRRFQRLLDILRNRRSVLFVFASGAYVHPQSDAYEYLCEIETYIYETYGLDNFRILAIHTNRNFPDTKRIMNYTIHLPETCTSDVHIANRHETTLQYTKQLAQAFVKLFTLQQHDAVL